MSIKPCTVYYTNHYVNKTVTQYIAKANEFKLENINNYLNNSDHIFISYGILRGTGEIFLKSTNYIYIDHGYMNSSDRIFTNDKKTKVHNLSGYFRVVRNDLYFNKSYHNDDKTRFNSLNLTLKDLNKKGEKIIISEPSEHVAKYLNLHNWLSDTIDEVKKHSDREIIIHNKFSNTPLNLILKRCICVYKLSVDSCLPCNI